MAKYSPAPAAAAAACEKIKRKKEKEEREYRRTPFGSVLRLFLHTLNSLHSTVQYSTVQYSAWHTRTEWIDLKIFFFFFCVDCFREFIIVMNSSLGSERSLWIAIIYTTDCHCCVWFVVAILFALSRQYIVKRLKDSNLDTHQMSSSFVDRRTNAPLWRIIKKGDELK